MQLKILATDVHPLSLEPASTGIYGEDQLAHVSAGAARAVLHEALDRLPGLAGAAPADRVRAAQRDEGRAVHEDALHLVPQHADLPAAAGAADGAVAVPLRLATGGVLFLGASETPGRARRRVHRDRRALEDLSASGATSTCSRRRASCRRCGRADARRLVALDLPRASRADPLMLATYDQLLDLFMPPSLLVDEDRLADRQLRRRRAAAAVSGRDGRRTNVARDARRRAADRRRRRDAARDQGEHAQSRTPACACRRRRREQRCTVTAEPLVHPRTGARNVLVTFQDDAAEAASGRRARSAPTPIAVGASVARAAGDARDRARRTRARRLQATIEELETSNEEMQATNEELVAVERGAAEHERGAALGQRGALHGQRRVPAEDHRAQGAQQRHAAPARGHRRRHGVPRSRAAHPPLHVADRVACSGSSTHDIGRRSATSRTTSCARADGRHRARAARRHDDRGRGPRSRRHAVLPAHPALPRACRSDGTARRRGADADRRRRPDAHRHDRARQGARARSRSCRRSSSRRDDAIVGKTLDGTITHLEPRRRAAVRLRRRGGDRQARPHARCSRDAERRARSLPRADRAAATKVEHVQRRAPRKDGTRDRRLDHALADPRAATAIARACRRSDATSRRCRGAARARGRARHKIKRCSSDRRGRAPPRAVPRDAVARAAQPARRRAQRDDRARCKPASSTDVVERCQRVIERQATHMARLLDDLLDVSRITRGKFELRDERLDLRDADRGGDRGDAAAVRRAPHRSSTCDAAAARRCRSDGDAARLQQVVVNLLSNAANYSPRGHARRARRRPRRRPGRCCASPTTAIGIEPELLGQDLRAVRAGRADARSLARRARRRAVAREEHRRAARRHDRRAAATATAWAASSSSGCPLGDAAVRDRRDDATPHGARLPHRPRRRSGGLARDAALLLESRDHVVFDARRRRRRRRARSRKRQPDVAFIDIGLPVMNGFEVAQQIRRHPDLKDVMLVALTGYGTRSDVQRAPRGRLRRARDQAGRAQDARADPCRARPGEPGGT